MDKSRIHTLVDSQNPDVLIGGALLHMRLGNVPASWTDISVEPITQEEREEIGEIDVLKIRFGGTVAFFDLEEASAFLNLVKIAIQAGTQGLVQDSC